MKGSSTRDDAPAYKYGVEYFNEKTRKAFKKLPPLVREQLHLKIRERRNNPEVPSARLSGYSNIYKIKIMKPPIRLCYEVRKDKLVLIILVVAPRGDVYKQLDQLVKRGTAIRK